MIPTPLGNQCSAISPKDPTTIPHTCLTPPLPHFWHPPPLFLLPATPHMPLHPTLPWPRPDEWPRPLLAWPRPLTHSLWRALLAPPPWPPPYWGAQRLKGGGSRAGSFSLTLAEVEGGGCFDLEGGPAVAGGAGGDGGGASLRSSRGPGGGLRMRRRSGCALQAARLS